MTPHNTITVINKYFVLKMCNLEMTSESFSVVVMVCGYLQRHLEAALGEEVCFEREPGNCQDPFAVAVVRSGVMFGHVPRRYQTMLQAANIARISWSAILVENSSAKSAKIVLLENLAPYGIQ